MSKQKKLGFITIGQSPRIDIIEDINKFIGDDIEILERGALDKYTYEDIKDKLSPSKEDTFLVSRMRDGRQVEIAEEKIHFLLQNCVDELNRENCSAIIIMCTGTIPKLKSSSLLISPQKVLHNIVKNIGISGKIGVFVPELDQKHDIQKAWGDMGIEIETVFASPYSSVENIKNEAEKFNKDSIKLIFMDCMGYSEKMKAVVRKITNKPIIIPRTLIVKIALEMI